MGCGSSTGNLYSLLGHLIYKGNRDWQRCADCIYIVVPANREFVEMSKDKLRRLVRGGRSEIIAYIGNEHYKWGHLLGMIGAYTAYIPAEFSILRSYSPYYMFPDAFIAFQDQIRRLSVKYGPDRVDFVEVIRERLMDILEYVDSNTTFMRSYSIGICVLPSNATLNKDSDLWRHLCFDHYAYSYPRELCKKGCISNTLAIVDNFQVIGLPNNQIRVYYRCGNIIRYITSDVSDYSFPHQLLTELMQRAVIKQFVIDWYLRSESRGRDMSAVSSSSIFERRILRHICRFLFL
jgi:hypothetical protein